MLVRGCVTDAQMNQNFPRSSVNLKTYIKSFLILDFWGCQHQFVNVL